MVKEVMQTQFRAYTSTLMKQKVDKIKEQEKQQICLYLYPENKQNQKLVVKMMENHRGGNEEEDTELCPHLKKRPRTIAGSSNLSNQNQWQQHIALMAESTSRYSGSNINGSSSSLSSSSPISRAAQDHLCSILLLLPIQSILCFGMTCKKFQSLTYSDSLWEAICRRDWGYSSVDALKSCQQQQELSWKKLYQQVYQLDTVYCHRILSDPDGDELPPSPRASHSLNFVSSCLVLFGGGCEGGRHLDDTWVAYTGHDPRRRILKWQKIQSGIPSGRFGHSCVVIGDSLVLFGGINDHGIRQNDTWVGQLAFDERYSISLSWKLLDVGSVAPPPRGAHASCCIDDKRMLIHGGIGLSGLRLGDTWMLDLTENLSFVSWQEVVTHPFPPSRSGHTLSNILGGQTILFGGRGSGYEVLNDVWLFDASEGNWRWVQLNFELQNIPHGFSLPRVGHSADLILGGRLLIHGGEDSYRRRKDDFWVLDIRSIASVTMQPVTFKQKELLARMWRRLKAKGDKPSSRSFHRACVDNSGTYMYLFGGMVDGLLQPAESLGLRFDGGLFLVEFVPQ